MGGDHAPAVVLRGADIALTRHPGVRFLLFGDEARVAPLLAKLPRLAKAATLHHTDEVVADDTKPSQALRADRPGAGPADRRAIECRLGGSEGQRCGPRRWCAIARRHDPDPISRFRRGR